MASPEKAQQGEIALPTGPRSLNGQRSSSEKAPCASPLWRALLLTALLLSPVLPILLGLRPLPFPVPFALHRSCHNENRDFINASPIDSWLAAESRYAYTQMLSNIGGGEDVTSNATSVPGAPAGTVVASPSTEAPDYYYSWLRDGALTMAVVIDLFVKGESNLDDFIQEYVGVEQTHQANDRGEQMINAFETFSLHVSALTMALDAHRRRWRAQIRSQRRPFHRTVGQASAGRTGTSRDGTDEIRTSKRSRF